MIEQKPLPDSPYKVKTDFNSYAPNKEEYDSADYEAKVKFYQSMGDQNRVAQLIKAEVSLSTDRWDEK